MKIKIIDLLNKIVNDEEIPEKIMYDRCLYTCDKITRTYYDKEHNTLWESYNFRILTDNVEIIEDPKKIEYEQIEELTCNEFDFEKKTINSLIKNQRKLIDEINNLKRE